MKNFLPYFFFLLFGFINAQIVNIPDANFKAKLLEANTSNGIAFDVNGNRIVIDINQDGEIQVSEALNVHKINLKSYLDPIELKIEDLTGIESFTNLIYLDCRGNLLTTIDLSNLVNLIYLYCAENSITTLDLDGLSNLNTLDCSFNSLTELNLSNLPLLLDVNCSFNSLTELSLQNLDTLTKLDCSHNTLAELDLSDLSSLLELNYSYNSLPNLNFSGLTSLISLNCSHNDLHEIDLSSLQTLIFLDCSYNSFANLYLSNLTSLGWLDCSVNNLTELDVSNSINLGNLYCSYNLGLNSLNINGLTEIRELNISFTDLSEIDLSSNPEMVFFECRVTPNLLELDLSNNPNIYHLSIADFGDETDESNLIYLNLKNGSDEIQLDLLNIPENCYICIDDEDIGDFDLADLPAGSFVNTYCAYAPGGISNNITGSITFDSENNGCDEDDLPQQFIKININDGVEEYSSFTDNAGNYIFYTQDGTYTLTPQVANSEYFNLNPETEIVTFPIVDNSTEIRDFCITADGIHPDVEIVIAPVAPARPGFSATYKVVYRNKGNQTVSGNIEFEFDENLSEFLSSNPIPDVQNFGILNYNFTDLLPFENREILIELEVNAPTDTPPVNIDDVLIFTSEITIPADENPEDNNYTFNQIVVGSYDPNDIICLEGENVSPDMIGEELHYFIRFENTGNHQAERIVISMEIDPDLYDISTLQLLNSSHEVQGRVIGNRLELFFEQLYLDSGGHGNILFKINSSGSLSVGDAVKSKADIYFDYNFPITTNEAETTFEILGLNEINPNVQVSIYPNPAKDFIKIKSDSKINKIELYDTSARLLKVSFTDKFELNQNLSTFPNGIYFVKIYTENGITTQKIIKNK